MPKNINLKDSFSKSLIVIFCRKIDNLSGFGFDKIVRDGFAAPTQANRLTDSPVCFVADENEMDIINDILSEIKEMEQISINLDRKDAIESSILEMERNNINGVLLIAGKGHENYQEVNKNLYELNDKTIVNSL